MIKAITFDLDGVYFPDGKLNFIKALGRLGVNKNDAAQVFLKSDEMNRRYKNGFMTDDEYWTWAAEQWGLKKAPEELINILIDSYGVSKEVAGVVRMARNSGYKTLICSNNFPARVNGLNDRFGFLDDFDAAVFSYDVGASKPDEKIFAELILKAKVEPESIVFADDNLDNLAGASSLGINTFVYEGFDGFMQKLMQLGVNF